MSFYEMAVIDSASFHLARKDSRSQVVDVFTPKWKKEAKLLLKGAQKFVHYKRDLLEEGKLGEITSRQVDLKKAIKAKDLTEVKEASKQLRNVC